MISACHPGAARLASWRGLAACTSLALALVTCASIPRLAGAQVPRTLSYQGLLSDSTGAPQPNGNYAFTFRLYDLGGSAVWTESKTLTLRNGLFSTGLGDQTPIPLSLLFNQPYWLGIQIGSSAELTPRTPLSSVGYSFGSFRADSAMAVRDSSIASRHIAGGQVVKSLNGFHDSVLIQADSGLVMTSSNGTISLKALVVRSLNGRIGDVTIQGAGGTQVSTSGNTITIGTLTAPGLGIQELRNTDHNLTIADSTGPTTTVNLALPMQLGTETAGPVLEVTNSSDGEAAWFSTPSGPNPAVVAYSGSSSAAYLWSEGDRSTVRAVNTGGGNAIYGDATGSAGAVVGWLTGIGTAMEGNNIGNGTGTSGTSTLGTGVYAASDAGTALFVDGEAAVFGPAYISGNLTVSGTINGHSPSLAPALQIDHPLEPSTKYLVHSPAASPDMMNIYSGNVVLDDRGEAWIELPSYIEALDRDFRYQLTAIGAAAPTLHVATKVTNHGFGVAGGTPGLEVSWQVTGIRKDPWAEAHPLAVEPVKGTGDQGRYLHPELFGQPKEQAIGWVPAPPAPATRKRPVATTQERLPEGIRTHSAGAHGGR